MSHAAGCLLLLLVAGCGAPPSDGQAASGGGTQLAKEADAKNVAPPEDLGTRKAGVDWPCFLGPTGDSRSPEQGIQAPWPDEGLDLVWQKQLGTGYGAPTVSRGRLFVFDRVGDQARLTCCESETGRELWKFEYPTEYEDMYGYNNGPRCCPVVDDDRVYLFGAEGMLHCLRVADGEPLWRVDTAADYDVVQNFFGVGSTPLVEGNLLIVQVGGSVPGRGDIMTGNLTPNGTGVVAFDKRTGQEMYRLADELASYASPTAATINGRRWCFVFARGGLLGFDPTTGKLDFHYPWRAKVLESVNASNPVVAKDRVFISECYGPGSALLQVAPAEHEVVWSDDPGRREKAMQTHWNTCILHEGHLYGSSGRHTENAELRCIDLATGRVRWSEPGLARSSLLYVEGQLVCLTEYGELLLLKATPEKFAPLSQAVVTEDGAVPLAVAQETNSRPLIRYPAWAAPVLSHGLLYLRDEHRLVCLELIPEPK